MSLYSTEWYHMLILVIFFALARTPMHYIRLNGDFGRWLFGYIGWLKRIVA